MRLTTLVALAALAAMMPARAEEPRRELGAHVHGAGDLDIAIEGQRLVMEFRAPGADIVGFEGEAKAPEAKAALAAAIATLEKPLALFVPPEAAKCTLVSAKVTVGDGEDDHAGSAEDKPGAPQAEASQHAGHADHDHSDFSAAYELTCADPAKLTTFDLAYFKAFPRAQKVAVQVITVSGQGAFDVTPAKPVLDLSALVR
jgi:hypothetical protein